MSSAGNELVNNSLINSTPAQVDPVTGAPQNLATPTPPPPASPPPPPAPQLAAPTTSPYTPGAYEVKPEQTVAGQIKDIIATGSPLMQQAETAAKNQANARGLINSSQAITAGQDAVYKSALPIAQADAARYAAASDKTMDARNTALQFNAAADNSAQIAKLQSDTTLSAQDMQDRTSVILQDTQTKLQTYLSQLQSNTSLTAQQMATEAQKAVAAANNVSAQAIARIQADTSLSVEDKQNQTQKIITEMNNNNAKAVQSMVNEGALANIKANGAINTQIEQITAANKTLLQTSASASQMYSQMLQTMSAITTSNTLTQEQKTQALNNAVQQLNSAMSVMSTISGIPGLESDLVFSASNTPGGSPASAGGADNTGGGNLGFQYGAYDQGGNYVGQGNGPYNGDGVFVG